MANCVLWGEEEIYGGQHVSSHNKTSVFISVIFIYSLFFFSLSRDVSPALSPGSLTLGYPGPHVPRPQLGPIQTGAHRFHGHCNNLRGVYSVRVIHKRRNERSSSLRSRIEGTQWFSAHLQHALKKWNPYSQA